MALSCLVLSCLLTLYTDIRIPLWGGKKFVNFCRHGERPTGSGWKGTGRPSLSEVPPPTAKSLGVTISARFCVLGGQNEEKRSNRSNLLHACVLSAHRRSFGPPVGDLTVSRLEPRITGFHYANTIRTPL